MANPRDPDDFSMSFGDHLEELRTRLLHSLVGFVVALCITSYYGRLIVTWLYEPLAEVQRQYNLPTQTYTRTVLAGFAIYFKVSLVAAVILAGPWILFQLWRFVRTGLYPSERRIFFLLAPLSGMMSTLAVLFTYYLFLPGVLSVLIFFTVTYPPPQPAESSTLHSVTQLFDYINRKTFEYLPGEPINDSAIRKPIPETQPTTRPDAAAVTVPVLDADPLTPGEGQVWFNRASGEMRLYEGGRIRLVALSAQSMMTPLIDPSDYIDDVLLLGLVIVAVFHVPVIMAALGMTGLVNPNVFSRYRKVIVFTCFALAFFITPNQDIFTDVVLPLIMWGLFEFGLILMRLVQRRRRDEPAGEA